MDDRHFPRFLPLAGCEDEEVVFGEGKDVLIILPGLHLLCLEVLDQDLLAVSPPAFFLHTGGLLGCGSHLGLLLHRADASTLRQLYLSHGTVRIQDHCALRVHLSVFYKASFGLPVGREAPYLEEARAAFAVGL